jgi:hypothetical protein
MARKDLWVKNLKNPYFGIKIPKIMTKQLSS